MEKLRIELPFSQLGRSFHGVAADTTATAKILVKNTINQSVLIYSGITLVQMEAVRIVINGETVREWKGGDELDRENQFFGRAAAAGELIIDHERMHQLSNAGRRITALGAGVAGDAGTRELVANTISVEVDIAAGVVAPVLKLRNELDLPAKTGNILHRRIKNISSNGSGLQEFTDLLNDGEAVYMIEFASQFMTELRIERNKNPVFERSKAGNKQVLIDEGLNPAAMLFDGVNESFVYFPNERGQALGLLVNSPDDDVVFKPSFSADDANFRIAITTISTLNQ